MWYIHRFVKMSDFQWKQCHNAVTKHSTPYKKLWFVTPMMNKHDAVATSTRKLVWVSKQKAYVLRGSFFEPNSQIYKKNQHPEQTPNNAHDRSFSTNSQYHQYNACWASWSVPGACGLPRAQVNATFLAQKRFWRAEKRGLERDQKYSNMRDQAHNHDPQCQGRLLIHCHRSKHEEMCRTRNVSGQNALKTRYNEKTIPCSKYSIILHEK